MRNHTTSVILQAFFMALSSHARPAIFHSDNGSEYASKIFVQVLTETGITISRIAPGCPWKNGYQELHIKTYIKKDPIGSFLIIISSVAQRVIYSLWLDSQSRAIDPLSVGLTTYLL